MRNIIDIQFSKGDFVTPYEDIGLGSGLIKQIDLIDHAFRRENTNEAINRYKLLVIWMCATYTKGKCCLTFNRDDLIVEKEYINSILEINKRGIKHSRSFKLLPGEEETINNLFNNIDEKSNKRLNKKLQYWCVDSLFYKCLLEYMNENFPELSAIDSETELNEYCKLLMIPNYEEYFKDSINWSDEALGIRIRVLYYFFTNFFEVILRKDNRDKELKN